MNTYFQTMINQLDSDLEEATGLSFKITQPEKGYVQYESETPEYIFRIRVPNEQILENRITRWKYSPDPSKEVWIDRNSRNFMHDVSQIVEFKQFDPTYLQSINKAQKIKNS